MIARQLRLAGLGLALLGSLVAGALAAWSGTSAGAAAAEGNDARVKALLQQRHATLKEIASSTREEYRAGKASLRQVSEANRAARQAELELCATDKERAAVLEAMLAEAKELERVAESRFRTGMAPRTAVLQATADRLEIEIAWERARASGGVAPEAPPAGGARKAGEPGQQPGASVQPHAAARANYEQAVAQVVAAARALRRASTPAEKAQAETNLFRALGVMDEAAAEVAKAEADRARAKARDALDQVEKARSQGEPKR